MLILSRLRHKSNFVILAFVTSVTKFMERESMVVDTQRLKENCNLRRLVEQDLGPAPLRGGRAYLWKCPFHNEHKGFSLAV